MPFGQLWKKNGTQIVPTSGIDTIRIPDTGEYATIERSATALTIKSFASGDASLILNSKGTSKIQGNSNNLIQWNDDPGLAFFGAAPVTQQAKPAAPTPDVAELKTAVDGIMEVLVAYGLMASS